MGERFLHSQAGLMIFAAEGRFQCGCSKLVHASAPSALTQCSES